MTMSRGASTGSHRSPNILGCASLVLILPLLLAFLPRLTDAQSCVHTSCTIQPYLLDTASFNTVSAANLGASPFCLRNFDEAVETGLAFESSLDSWK